MTWLTFSDLCLAIVILALAWHAVDFYRTYARHSRMVQHDRANRLVRLDQFTEARQARLRQLQADLADERRAELDAALQLHAPIAPVSPFDQRRRI